MEIKAGRHRLKLQVEKQTNKDSLHWILLVCLAVWIFHRGLSVHTKPEMTLKPLLKTLVILFQRLGSSCSLESSYPFPLMGGDVVLLCIQSSCFLKSRFVQLCWCMFGRGFTVKVLVFSSFPSRSGHRIMLQPFDKGNFGGYSWHNFTPVISDLCTSVKCLVSTTEPRSACAPDGQAHVSTLRYHHFDCPVYFDLIKSWWLLAVNCCISTHEEIKILLWQKWKIRLSTFSLIT